ncbi:MAG: hypothetical protein LUC43_02025 [Burkholderiales bacterium]|nr:hypothetical protein [Burkholderiales bacterium]
MIIITAVQSLFGFMTVSPKLFDQFIVLVDLAVMTNIMPYILSMAAVAVIMKKAEVPLKEAKLYTTVGFVGAVYSFYAMASAGTMEVFWGSIVTFFGWTLWGFIATRFSPAQDQAL